MWRHIEIESFRGFDRFALGDLGRVNLLVGENNSGKTSVLEAIDLLTAANDPARVWTTLARRGETPDEEAPRISTRAVDVTHLIFGHREGTFELRAMNDKSTVSLRARLSLAGDQLDSFREPVPEPDDEKDLGVPYQSPDRGGGSLTLRYDVDSHRVREVRLPVGPGGELAWNDIQRHRLYRGEDGRGPVQFLTTRSLNTRGITALFGKIALQDEEETVIDALRSVEPTIERIALVAISAANQERGGLAVRLTGSPRRVPIGSLGDGIWRLLALALCLVRARGGILLVDEIDTGLHYSVLSKMWTLVMKTAERLDVQVFATTHSRDCYESLAAICRDEPEGGSRVSIQRIERGKTKAVAFTEREILLAAERGIEVR